MSDWVFFPSVTVGTETVTTFFKISSFMLNRINDLFDLINWLNLVLFCDDEHDSNTLLRKKLNKTKESAV